jgi:hypothetical protein
LRVSYNALFGHMQKDQQSTELD